jgi:hypothetical protein
LDVVLRVPYGLTSPSKWIVLSKPDRLKKITQCTSLYVLKSFLEFAEQKPTLSQVIHQGLFATDTEIRDHVYRVYEEVFKLMMNDLEEEGIIRHRKYALTSDLTTILLSAIFTGGCPQLILEYGSWVDYYRVASSILDALQRRYQSNDIGRTFLNSNYTYLSQLFFIAVHSSRLVSPNHAMWLLT